MKHLRRCRLGLLLLGALTLGGVNRAHADPPPPRAEEAERWIGLRVNDPALRLRAVADTKGPLNEVADAIPFLVIALDDESPPVAAAARQRLHELADEAVTPLLDALQSVRPGRRSGAFGALSALGNTVTPADLAVAAGALAPVNPPDRREAAVVLALPAGTPAQADRLRLTCSLRLAATLLLDSDAQVRRAAAAAAAIVGWLHVRAAEAQKADPEARRSWRIRLSKGQQERLVELMAQGSPDVAGAAAALAGRFEDASIPIVDALIALLAKEDRRDAAALALADLGEAAAAAAGPQLAKYASYGTWRALLRLRQDEDQVLKALTSTDKTKRRLAAAAALAERRGAPEAVEALLPELEEALDDGRFEDVEPWLRRLAEWGREGRPALPLLQKFVESKAGDPYAKDLAAAVAFGVDREQVWAAKRVESLLAEPEAKAASKSDPHHELSVRTALAVYYDGQKAVPATVPLAVSSGRLLDLSLTGQVVVGSLVACVSRTEKPGPHLEVLLAMFGTPTGPPPPALADLAKHGAGADCALGSALLALAVVPDVTVEHRKLVEALLSARDPWLRHRAAQVLRRRWPS